MADLQKEPSTIARADRIHDAANKHHTFYTDTDGGAQKKVNRPNLTGTSLSTISGRTTGSLIHAWAKRVAGGAGDAPIKRQHEKHSGVFAPHGAAFFFFSVVESDMWITVSKNIGVSGEKKCLWCGNIPGNYLRLARGQRL